MKSYHSQTYTNTAGERNRDRRESANMRAWSKVFTACACCLVFASIIQFIN